MTGVAIVEITNIRIYLPEGMDIDDEDAVNAYVRSNLGRVTEEAASNVSPRDVFVTHAYYEKETV